MGWVQRRQGKWTEALENIKRASELDPHSALLAFEVGATYNLLRDYPQAERYYDRAISLDPEVPDFYLWKWSFYLAWDGGTERAKEVLQEARVHVDEKTMVEEILLTDIFDREYEDALNRLASVSSATVGASGGVVGSYVPTVQYYAEIYNLMGEDQVAQSYFDSARVLLEEKIRESPEDPQFRTALGIAYAGLGRSEDAIREGKLGVELLSVSKEAIQGYRLVSDLAKIYTMVGEHDAAIDELDYLLSIPGELSAPLLRLDPDWAPLRGQPRFQELLAKYALSNH
jgi:tetratricopeptide (TPR) repeat protein